MLNMFSGSEKMKVKINWNKEKIIKSTMLVVLMFCLAQPLLRRFQNISDPAELKGSFVLAENNPFTWSGWFSHDYQIKREEYLRQTSGLMATYVKLHNQIAFSLFKEAKANNVLVGKDNYLFQEEYITSYLGKDYMGKEKIRQLVDQIEFLRDTLKKINKHLVIAISPNKAAYFPDKIPDRYFRTARKTSNYEALLSALQQKNIPVLDFNALFIQSKDRSSYPLFSPYGIHWSAYGMYFAADTLIRFLEAHIGFSLPHLILESVSVSRQYQKTDMDLSELMNLFYKLEGPPMGYPQVRIEQIPDSKRPKTIIISDSFFWGLYHLGLIDKVFDGSFWYYYREVYPSPDKLKVNIENVDRKKEFYNAEAIFLLVSPIYIDDFSWGFIDQLYNYLKGNKDNMNNSLSLERIAHFEKKIRGNRDWMEMIRKKAMSRKIPVDSMIHEDARFMAMQEKINKE